MDFDDVPRGWLQQCTIRAYIIIITLKFNHVSPQKQTGSASCFRGFLRGLQYTSTKIDSMMNVEPPGLAPFSSQPQSRLFHSGFWNNDLYGNPTCHQGQKRDKTWDYLKIKAPVGEAGVPVVWDHFPIQMLCHKSRDEFWCHTDLKASPADFLRPNDPQRGQMENLQQDKSTRSRVVHVQSFMWIGNRNCGISGFPNSWCCLEVRG